MRKVLISLWFFVCLIGCGSEIMAQERHSFMPDNTLWMEDGLHYYARNNVDQSTFNRIISIAEQVYAPIAQNWRERLTISRLWEDPTVNASAWRDGQGNTEIRMYGGMARRPEVYPLSFALVLCHELSHLYGGAPYIEPRVWIAAEGQSDWMGAGWCMRNIFDRLQDQTQMPTTQYMGQLCNNNTSCVRRLAGAQGLGNLLAQLTGEYPPRYENPDRTVVSRTEVSYPRTIQCRLDSYRAGTLNQSRPLCWYKP